MVKNLYIKTSFLLCVIVTPISIQPIYNSTANYGTAFTAFLCAGGSYEIIREFPSAVHPAVLAGASGMITFGAYYLLHRSTPIGRIKRANTLLNEISRHTLARTTFDNDRLFFDAVQDVYLTDDLPLISAYNHLLVLIPNVHYALGLINKASAEVGKDVLLQEECDASRSRGNKLFRNIADAVKRIREHKDYLSQLTIYKEGLTQEKQTIAQEQMALAQLQMAHAQQGNTLLKWFKALFGGK
jgi:hypothetical protein